MFTLILFACLPAQSYDLAATEKYSEKSFLFVEKTRSMLINREDHVDVWDVDQKRPEVELDLREKGQVGSMGFIPSHEFYVVTVFNDYGKGPILTTYLFDIDGASIGQVYDHNKDPDKDPTAGELGFSQYLNANNHLYLNIWDRELIGAKEPPLLQEFRLVPHGYDGWAFEPISNKFSYQDLESRFFGNNYFARWIVEKDAGEFLVVDELQPRVWLFRSDDRSIYEEEQTPYSLNLDKRVFHQKYKRDDQSNAEWLSSFSRVTGFAKLKQGYVITYFTPNSDHRSHNRDGVGASSDNLLFTLCIQKLDKNLSKIGSPIEKPGAFYIGSSDDRVFLYDYDNENKKYAYSLLNVSDF